MKTIWYHQERQWDDDSDGYVVFERGTRNKIECPKCTYWIVYNGNYFCGKYNRGDCSWILLRPVKEASDKEICDLIGIKYF